jgi:DNA-binding beta-propeller fold protein YncE
MVQVSDVFQPLLPEMVLNKRYRITKKLSFVSNHGVYLARDIKITEKIWLVKEFIFPEEKFSQPELLKREEQYYATLDVIVNFEHRSLPRILDFFKECNRHYLVTEPVEGLTLKALCEMTPEQLPEQQVLEWSLQISDALSYLHTRPKPLVGSELDPAHIMVIMGETSNQIRLVNLGLNRFFDPDHAGYAFSTSIIDIAEDFHELGKTLYYLFAKKEYSTEIFFNALPKVSEKTNKIVQRCLSDEPQRNYRDAKDLMRDVDRILHPPAPAVVEIERKPVREMMFYNFLIPTRENIDKALFAVLSQKVSTFFIEVIALVILLGFVYAYSRPGWNYTRTSPVIICACKNELLTFQWQTRRMIDRRTIEGTIAGMASSREGDQIFLANGASSTIMVMNALHNDFCPPIRVDRGASNLIYAYPFIYLLSESTDNLSVVSTEQKKMLSVVPTGKKPMYMAYLSQKGMLFVADSGIDSIHACEPVRNKNRGIIQIKGGVGPIALSPEGDVLYICNTKWDGLTLLDTESLAVIQEIPAVGLKRPTCMKLFPDRENLMILDGDSHSLIVFSLKEKKTTGTAKVGKYPVDMTFDSNGKVWVANYGSHNIAIVNPRINYVEPYINVGRNPTSIFFLK